MSKPICPTCGGFIPNNDTPGLYPGATSRRDNKTEICSACGLVEATIHLKRNDGGWLAPDRRHDLG